MPALTEAAGLPRAKDLPCTLTWPASNASAPTMPRYEGIESFRGQSFHTYNWPAEPVDLTGKRLGLLKEVLPRATRVAYLWNPDSVAAESTLASVRSAAARIEGLEGQVRDLSTRAEAGDVESGKTRETEEMLHRTLLLAQRAAPFHAAKPRDRRGGNRM